MGARDNKLANRAASVAVKRRRRGVPIPALRHEGLNCTIVGTQRRNLSYQTELVALDVHADTISALRCSMVSQGFALWIIRWQFEQLRPRSSVVGASSSFLALSGWA